MQQTSIPLPDLLTFKEAMRFLRVSRSTLYRMMWSGELTGYKVSSTYRFLQADLRRYLKSHRIQMTETLDTTTDVTHQQI